MFEKNLINGLIGSFEPEDGVGPRNLIVHRGAQREQPRVLELRLASGLAHPRPCEACA